MNNNASNTQALFLPSGCLAGDTLSLFVSGSLSADDNEKVRQHLAECPLCTDAAEGLGKWLNENQSAETHDPDIAQHERLERKAEKLNALIRKRIHEKTIRDSRIKNLSYKPVVWYAAAAAILLFVAVGYIVWMQNQHELKLQAQKLQKDRELALMAQIPENLAYPPSNTNVILNIKYNHEKGSHIPPVVSIVKADVALAAGKTGSVGNSTGRTADETEYTESRDGVESDVLRDESGMYKGQNSKHGIATRNSGGATRKTDTDDDSRSVFISVREMPSFPGGEIARLKYLARNLRYPAQAAEEGIQGTVYVSFVVKTNGSLSDIKILRGIGGGCDDEALRVVKKMPTWIPGAQNGKNVPVLYTLKVDFRLRN
jgi:TonB family protein